MKIHNLKMIGGYMSTEPLNKLRLVPVLMPSPQRVEATHFTREGNFGLSSYIFDSDDKYGATYTIVILFYANMPVQKYYMGRVDEYDNNFLINAFPRAEAEYMSLEIHTMFGEYLTGEKSPFPILRALGWAFVNHAQILDLHMAEQRMMGKVAKVDPAYRVAGLWVSHYAPERLYEDTPVIMDFDEAEKDVDDVDDVDDVEVEDDSMSVFVDFFKDKKGDDDAEQSE